MEFRFDIERLLHDEVTVVDNSLILSHWKSATRNRLEYQQLYEMTNAIGEASSFAQGLNRIITTSDKLQNSDHTLYLMKEYEPDLERTVLVGMLKIGRKKLFLLDPDQKTREVAPLCVLDFYIHESRQRRGYGRRLFDFMLRHQKVTAGHMAVDKPSDKFLAFFKKHYGLVKQVQQINNFVVFDVFFQDRPVKPEEAVLTHVTRSNRSSRTASPEGSNTPQRGVSQTSNQQHYAGKPTRIRDSNIPLYSAFKEMDARKTYLDQHYTSDILHGNHDRHSAPRFNPRHQTTLDWMRGGGDSPYAYSPSYSPSRTPSYTGSPITRTPRESTPPATPPNRYSRSASRKLSIEAIDAPDGVLEKSIAPTPATSPDRREVPKEDKHEGHSPINGVNDDVESVSSKMEDASIADGISTPGGKTGAWRDSVSRNSEGLVEHMTNKGSGMGGVLRDNESVHGHLKFHHHALW